MTPQQTKIYQDWRCTGDSLLKLAQRHNVDKACVSRSIDKGLISRKINAPRK